MTSTFLALLHNLHVSENLGGGDRIGEALRITNDRLVVERLIPQPFRPMLGQLEATALLSGQLVAFSVAPIPHDMSPQQFLISHLYDVQALLAALWICEDNSVNTELGFLLHTVNGIAAAESNFIGLRYSNSSGSEELLNLTRDELRVVRDLHRSFLGRPDHPFQSPVTQVSSESQRVSRSLYFIGAARHTSDLGIKIAHYCTAYETLFSTAQTELAHQLSERVACFLSTDLLERQALYKQVKNAYGIRSKVVHGSVLAGTKLSGLVDCSRQCDSIARRIFSAILEDSTKRALFSMNASEFDDELLRLILHGAS